MNRLSLKNSKSWILTGCLFVFLVSTTGCINIIETQRERPDQDISGANQGYITGQVPPEQPKAQAKTRTYYELDITWPPDKEDFRSAPAGDKELHGNRGYISGKPSKQKAEKKPAAAVTLKPAFVAPKIEVRPVPQEISWPKGIKIDVSKVEKQVKTYKVKKGDTLQKISAEFYGTTKKWNLIYKANKGKMKSPDKLYPGRILTIPAVENR